MRNISRERLRHTPVITEPVEQLQNMALVWLVIVYPVASAIERKTTDTEIFKPL